MYIIIQGAIERSLILEKQQFNSTMNVSRSKSNGSQKNCFKPVLLFHSLFLLPSFFRREREKGGIHFVIQQIFTYFAFCAPIIFSSNTIQPDKTYNHLSDCQHFFTSHQSDPSSKIFFSILRNDLFYINKLIYNRRVFQPM